MVKVRYCEFGTPPTIADNWNHPPTTDDPWWQESSVFIWGNPRRGFGGVLRWGIHPNQGVANLYAWIVWGGATIYRRHFVDQALPTGDLLNSMIATAGVRTLDPLMKFELSVRDQVLALQLRWTNFHWPVAMSLNVGSATLAAGHYNMMGAVHGELSYAGETFDVSGAGFNDHSWGVRRRHLPASRSYFCVFDPEFYLAAMPVLTEEGERRMLGYVRHGGKLGRLGTDSRLGYSLQDDWITVGGANSYFYDEHDRGFHVTGRTIGAASSQTMGHGKLVHHAVAQFECGGRLGQGILETAHPKRMRPDQVEELGLDVNSWWLHEPPA